MDMVMEKKKLLPPDEQRCSLTGGRDGWGCKNFRMGLGAEDENSVPQSKYCEKHYYVKKIRNNYYKYAKQNKKVCGDGEGAGCSGTGGSERRKKVTVEDDRSNDDTADTIIERGTANLRRKRKNVERTEGSSELESFTRTREPEVESDSLEHYKSMCFELSVELEKKKVECNAFQRKLAEEVVETRKADATDETEHTPTDATACWKKMFSDLESRLLRMENENSTMRCVESRISNLERLVLRMEDKNSAMSRCIASCISKLDTLGLRMENENSTVGCVESRVSKLESLVLRLIDRNSTMAGSAESCIFKLDALGLRMENENSTMGYLESRISKLESLVLRVENESLAIETRISNLESLVLRRGKESSVLRCVELRNSEKSPESELQGLQKDDPQSGEKQLDKNNSSRSNAETSSGGKKGSHVHECKTKEKVLNVYDIGSIHLSSGTEKIKEGKEWGCVEERPSPHGLSSQDQLEMSKKRFVNLISDDESEDSDSSDDSNTSLGTLMDMLAMKYRNRNENQDIQWKFEDDMLSSLEEDPELNMKAVCALYRQHIAEVEISAKGLFHYSDALRGTTLAKFLMDGDCNGGLKKSVIDLEALDFKAVDDCKRLARSYSKQLFSIYQNGKDPYFLPTTTSSREDQTAK